MIFFLLCLVAFVVATYPIRSHSVLSSLGYDPARLLKLLFVFSAALWALPLFKKSDDIEYLWFGYYFLGAWLSIAALSLGSRISPSKEWGISNNTAINLLILASLPYAIYILGTGTLAEQINSVFQESLIQLRADHWNAFGQDGNAFLFLSSCLAFPGALIWPQARRGSWKFYYSLFLMLSFTFSTISTGSRVVLAFAAFVILISIYSLNQNSASAGLKRLPARLVMFSVVALVAYYVFYYALAERLPSIEYRFAVMSDFILGSPPTDAMLKLNEETAGAAGVLAISISYFSSPLTFFEIFMRDMEICACTSKMGAYNFPFLDVLLGENWFHIRSQIASFWQWQGYAANPWSTGLRDFLIDFGSIGALIFIAVFFFGLGALIRISAENQASLGRLAGGYFTGICLITPFLSPLFILNLSIPMYGLVILSFMTKKPISSVSTPSGVPQALGSASDVSLRFVRDH